MLCNLRGQKKRSRGWSCVHAGGRLYARKFGRELLARLVFGLVGTRQPRQQARLLEQVVGLGQLLKRTAFDTLLDGDDLVQLCSMVLVLSYEALINQGGMIARKGLGFPGRQGASAQARAFCFRL